MLNRIKKKIGLDKTKTIPKDIFMTRLGSSVIGEGMLHEGNIYLMDYSIKNMPKTGDVIEIGCHGGLSTNLLLHLMRKHNRKEKFFNCDPWIYLGYNDGTGTVPMHIDGNQEVSRLDYMEYIKQAYKNGVSLLSKNQLPHTFDVTSDAFFAKYESSENLTDLFGNTAQPSRKISFAYIDGDHSYEQAKKDFQNVDASLLKGGFVLFDDSVDGTSFGSAHFMKEMKENTSYKLIDKNPNYLFQKV